MALSLVSEGMAGQRSTWKGAGPIPVSRSLLPVSPQWGTPSLFTHVIGEDHSKFPDLVLDVNRGDPKEKKRGEKDALQTGMFTAKIVSVF